MESFTIRMLTLFIICWTLNTGFGLPLLDNPEKRDDSPHPAHIRTKRCSCNSWDDKECIYFCHLDIIWVNTPDKILPYGLGDPRSRRRRSVNRCECLDSADKSCRGFCQQRTDTMGPVTKPEHRNSHKFLEFLRSVIKTNTKVVKGYQSMKNPSRHQKLKNQTRR